MALTDKLTAIADAIRGKTGQTASLTLDQMVTEIEGIEASDFQIPSNAKLYYVGKAESTMDVLVFESSADGVLSE